MITLLSSLFLSLLIIAILVIILDITPSNIRIYITIGIPMMFSTGKGVVHINANICQQKDMKNIDDDDDGTPSLHPWNMYSFVPSSSSFIDHATALDEIPKSQLPFHTSPLLVCVLIKRDKCTQEPKSGCNEEPISASWPAKVSSLLPNTSSVREGHGRKPPGPFLI